VKHGFSPALTLEQSSSASAFLPRIVCYTGSASACSTSFLLEELAAHPDFMKLLADISIYNKLTEDEK
jgi:hypothetical protein